MRYAFPPYGRCLIRFRYAFPPSGRRRYLLRFRYTRGWQEDAGEVVVAPKPIRHSVSFDALFCLLLVSFCRISLTAAAAGAN